MVELPYVKQFEPKGANVDSKQQPAENRRAAYRPNKLQQQYTCLSWVQTLVASYSERTGKPYFSLVQIIGVTKPIRVRRSVP